MRFESDKHSSNPKSGAELLLTLETQPKTGHKTVLAQVKGNQSHILKTLLSDSNQSQYDGLRNDREHEPRLDQTQARLGEQLRSGGGDASLTVNRQGLLPNSGVTIGLLSSKSQWGLQSWCGLTNLNRQRTAADERAPDTVANSATTTAKQCKRHGD